MGACECVGKNACVVGGRVHQYSVFLYFFHFSPLHQQMHHRTTV